LLAAAVEERKLQIIQAEVQAEVQADFVQQ
jgi:hypothetical protein